jgi:E3 ubiquitin-protein ligase HUWE1
MYIYPVICGCSRRYFAGELPIARSAVLKHILRSMHRMMQSSGTAEGLRGLIDLSLLQSIKKIIQHRGIFGPNVLPLGVWSEHIPYVF